MLEHHIYGFVPRFGRQGGTSQPCGAPIMTAANTVERRMRHGQPWNTSWSNELDIKKEVLAVIDDVLSLGGRAASFELDTPLLGAVPELDSMAVVGLLNMLEERFGFILEDDEIDGSTFATVGTLVALVETKLS